MIVHVEEIGIHRMVRGTRFSLEEIQSACQHSSDELDRAAALFFRSRNNISRVMELYNQTQPLMSELGRKALIRYIAYNYYRFDVLATPSSNGKRVVFTRNT